MKNFMKLLVYLGAVLTLGLGASAARPETELAYRVSENATFTHDLISRRAFLLSRSQLERINEELYKIRQIIEDDGVRPVPYPGPTPNPTPYPQTVAVRGAIESRDFSFEVSDLLDLHEKCVAFTQRNGLIQVDEIQVSVNFGPIQVLNNRSSYWKSSNEICNQITAVARTGGVRMPDSRKQILIGSIETRDFTFTGYSKWEVNQQCEAFLSRNGLLQVDDILVSTNFERQIPIRNNTGYWNTKLEICSQVMKYMQ